MNKIFGFVLAFSFVACNSGDKKNDTLSNTDLIQQNLKGKVQRFEDNATIIDSLGKSKVDSTISITDFDERGYQSTYTTKDLTGKVTMEQQMKHNPDGTFSEMITKKNGKQTESLVTEAKDGKYTSGKTYDSTGKQDSYYTDLKTNENGVVYAGKQHFMDDRIKSTFDMKYDGPHFLGGTTTDSTGKTIYTGTVKLNDKGDAMKENMTTVEKDITKKEILTYKYDSYDDKGNWTQRTTYNDKGKPTKIIKRTFSYFKD